MRLEFSNVLRNRPIVLTEHEVWSLSRAVGRDTLPELEAICSERYEVVTLGQLMRTLTATLSNRRMKMPLPSSPTEVVSNAGLGPKRWPWYRQRPQAPAPGVTAFEPVQAMEPALLTGNEADLARERDQLRAEVERLQKGVAPLTDERIRRLWLSACNDVTDRLPFMAFARLLEREHSIATPLAAIDQTQGCRS